MCACGLVCAAHASMTVTVTSCIMRASSSLPPSPWPEAAIIAVRRSYIPTRNSHAHHILSRSLIALALPCSSTRCTMIRGFVCSRHPCKLQMSFRKILPTYYSLVLPIMTQTVSFWQLCTPSSSAASRIANSTHIANWQRIAHSLPHIDIVSCQGH